MYQVKFRLSGEKGLDRYVALYTQQTLNADLYIFDSEYNLLMKLSGTAGKKPTKFEFPEEGIYIAKVVAFSGDGPFFMLIANEDEYSEVIKQLK
jgi:hypothetical protein